MDASNATGALRAVKIVHRSSFGDAWPFEREFEGIRKFEKVSRSHPSQLAIFHVGRNDPAGCFYYVMELADAANAVRNQEPEARSQKANSATSAPFRVAPECYLPHSLRNDLSTGRLSAERVLELGLALAEAQQFSLWPER